MVSNDLVYGICPDCAYAYTEPVDDFARWLPRGCPRCSSQREPHPVRDEVLPRGPDLIPIKTEEVFFSTPKTTLLLLLCRGFGYRVGLWIDNPPNAAELSATRRFAIGDASGGVMHFRCDEIEAAWRIGDRPGHHE
jgi:hypothetical protein